MCANMHTSRQHKQKENQMKIEDLLKKILKSPNGLRILDQIIKRQKERWKLYGERIWNY